MGMDCKKQADQDPRRIARTAGAGAGPGKHDKKLKPVAWKRGGLWTHWRSWWCSADRPGRQYLSGHLAASLSPLVLDGLYRAVEFRAIILAKLLKLALQFGELLVRQILQVNHPGSRLAHCANEFV